MRLRENYLNRMPPEYISYVTVVDQHDKEIATKTLSEANNVIEIPMTPTQGAPPVGGPSASGR
jgi:hypothetical protein